ncbi:unnamed protein product [Brachionus calyciflorus]|uniref:Uncharacterized protein n=1 Tax=Brachionus calyciflorus TaxID=104777 RepID=A0A813VUL1_9BILA|nr:unnamed protein product [Brachionus calyciflorus]
MDTHQNKAEHKTSIIETFNYCTTCRRPFIKISINIEPENDLASSKEHDARACDKPEICKTTATILKPNSTASQVESSTPHLLQIKSTSGVTNQPFKSILKNVSNIQPQKNIENVNNPLLRTTVSQLKTTVEPIQSRMELKTATTSKTSLDQPKGAIFQTRDSKTKTTDLLKTEMKPKSSQLHTEVAPSFFRTDANPKKSLSKITVTEQSSQTNNPQSKSKGYDQMNPFKTVINDKSKTEIKSQLTTVQNESATKIRKNSGKSLLENLSTQHQGKLEGDSVKFVRRETKDIHPRTYIFKKFNEDNYNNHNNKNSNEKYKNFDDTKFKMKRVSSSEDHFLNESYFENIDVNLTESQIDRLVNKCIKKKKLWVD